MNCICPVAKVGSQQSHTELKTLSLNTNILLFDDIKQVDAFSWNSIYSHNHFASLEYFKAFEEANLSNIKNIYVLFKRGTDVIGKALFQQIQFSGEQTKHYLQEKEGQPIKNFFIRLAGNFASTQSGSILVLGNLLVTGDHGYKFTNQVSNAEKKQLIELATQQVNKTYGKCNMTLYKDFPEKDIDKTNPNFKGFSHFLADPNMKMEMSWNTWDDYLANLSSKYRVRTKKVYKQSKALNKVEINAENFDAHKDDIQKLYDNIMDNIGFKMAVANADYFGNITKSLGDKMLIYGYELDGKLVAFNTALLQGDEYEVHLIGLDYQQNNALKLYNRILYDNLQNAIELGYNYIGYGRTANEIKSTVGATPNTMHCYMHFNNPIINMFTSNILKAFKPKDWVQRHPFKQANN